MPLNSILKASNQRPTVGAYIPHQYFLDVFSDEGKHLKEGSAIINTTKHIKAFTTTRLLVTKSDVPLHAPYPKAWLKGNSRKWPGTNLDTLIPSTFPEQLRAGKQMGRGQPEKSRSYTFFSVDGGYVWSDFTPNGVQWSTCLVVSEERGGQSSLSPDQSTYLTW